MDIAFNNGWLFTEDYDAGFDKASSVRLPHTAREIPYNYIDCHDYQMVCGYRKSFTAPLEWQDKRLILRAILYCALTAQRTRQRYSATERVSDITPAATRRFQLI